MDFVTRAVPVAIWALSCAAALFLVIMCALALVDKIEHRIEMRRWPGNWTRWIWSSPCPTCHAPAFSLCVPATDADRASDPLQVVPHQTRVVAARVPTDCVRAAVRGYSGDVFFLHFGKRGRRDARKLVAAAWPVAPAEQSHDAEPGA